MSLTTRLRPITHAYLACILTLVLLALPACRGLHSATTATSPAVAPTASPSPPGSPGTGAVQTYRFRIQQLDVTIAQSQPAQISVLVSSYYPDSCTKAREPLVSRAGNAVTVELTGERPTGVACSTIARPFQTTVQLGSFSSGHYTLQVNDQQTTFNVP